MLWWPVYAISPCQLWQEDRSEPQHPQRTEELDDQLAGRQFCLLNKGKFPKKMRKFRNYYFQNGGKLLISFNID